MNLKETFSCPDCKTRVHLTSTKLENFNLKVNVVCLNCAYRNTWVVKPKEVIIGGQSLGG